MCEHKRVGPLTNPNVVSHCPVLAKLVVNFVVPIIGWP
jgi:hypothetical protein